MAGKKPTRVVYKHGEDFLHTLERLTLHLESGQDATFDIQREVQDWPTGYPHKFSDTVSKVEGAVARFAFWAYQTERALSAVREQEHALVQLRAASDGMVREQLTDDRVAFTESQVRAVIDTVSDVQNTTDRLNQLREHYGYIRALRDAMGHRVFVLQTMLKVEVEPTRAKSRKRA